MTKLNDHPAKRTLGTPPTRLDRPTRGGPPGYAAAPERNERVLFAISLVGAVICLNSIVAWFLLAPLLGGVVFLIAWVVVSTLLAAVVLTIAWGLR
jgi:hypothetical protein